LVPALLIRPDDLEIDFPTGPRDIATLKRLFADALVSGMAIHVGSKLSGLISAEDAKLFEAAVKGGHKDKDFVQKSLKALEKIATSVTKVDVSKLVPTSNQRNSRFLL
jgi:hypothetical protein